MGTKLHLDSPLDSIAWPLEIKKFFDSQKFLNNLGSIYTINIYFTTRCKYVDRQLLRKKGFRKVWYKQVNHLLKKAGLPDLKSSLKISREGDINRFHDGDEGGSSG
jgi:hypothetical protein